MKGKIVLKAPPDRTEKVSDNIINQIRRLIASGELKPGDKIGSEKELLGQLGVSKASLREAIRVLEVMGMIEIRKGLAGGVYVADVDMKTTLTGITSFINFESVSLKDITLMRYILEPMIVRIVALLISETDVKNLQDTMQRETSVNVASGVAVKGIGFHRGMARITHNPILILVSDFIDNLLTDLKVQVKFDDDFYQKVRSFHQQVLDALKNRDVEQAIRMLITDILFVDEKLASSLKAERFDPSSLPLSLSPEGNYRDGRSSGTAGAIEVCTALAKIGGPIGSEDQGKKFLREVSSGRLYLFLEDNHNEEKGSSASDQNP